jgi:isopentenyldiphosphate isomerase
VGDKTILEFNAVYEGKIDSSSVLKLQVSEVSDTKWYEVGELKQLMRDDPDSFTPGFIELITRFYNI